MYTYECCFHYHTKYRARPACTSVETDQINTTSFDRDAFSCSATLTLTSPGYWTTLGNQCPGLFTPSFVCSQHTALRKIILVLHRQQTPPFQSTKSHLDQVEPWRFTSSAQSNSCQASVGFEPRTSQSVECVITTVGWPDSSSFFISSKLAQLHVYTDQQQ